MLASPKPVLGLVAPSGETGIAAARPLISARGVSKTYRTVSGALVRALETMDIDIGEGDFVSIVGPSGCGKSTFLRLLAGLEEASAGTLSLSGKPLKGPSQDIGVVFQEATLLPWLTVADNIGLPGRVGGRRDDTEPRVKELLRVVGLSAFGDKYPYELSGGMQQRAAICRALLRDPKALLMDEPFGALDALTRERLNIELQRIWMASRKTVVLITHSIGESVFLGDRVIVMSSRPGKILMDIRVDLPRPRNFEETTGDPEYLRLTREIRAQLDRGAHAE